MRSFEMLSAIFNVLLLVWLMFAPNKSQKGLVAGFGISTLLLVIHAFVEGMRWPMIPIYVITVFPILIFAKRSLLPSREQPQKTSRLRMTLLTILAALLSFTAVALPLLFPVFTFKKPTGPFAVGTVTYHWTDEKREEISTPEPEDKRELMVQIWYPANSAAKGARAPYVSNPDMFAAGYHKVLQFPELMFSSFAHVKTYAIEAAPLSETEAQYPVLVFSHGLSGYKNQNMFQVEQLASQGYIVVGIDHTYSSITSLFSDGRVANFIPQEMSVKNLDKLNEQWVEDAVFVLDQIEKLAKNDLDHRFTGRMDMGNLGMFGHSFGGATSVQMLMTDSRVKAAINMDGALFGQLRIPADGLKKPFLMISADDTLRGADLMTDEVIAAQGTTREAANAFYDELLVRYQPVATGGNYWMKLTNAKHFSFSDLYLLTPLFDWIEGIDVRRTHQLTNDYTLDFFNHYLKQQPFQYLEQSIGENPDFTLLKG
ncbi:dienelactone hydrolase family protein [Paenibacillus sp. UMB4589-SE434]|uniref:alpha/beta hydrolase family protein n=1 Tax=Paenibacillus sp. UMB4589-SE434 TaxID=3046314 RepID=UPI002549F57A|nr:dienelactone hydrolase family protein [Paenibacillus sp. UMB4589-SE434]MDK8181334.1 dienelactone hydrolase family protein [Paenibacillus sp. UMB4589-SE434]